MAWLNTLRLNSADPEVRSKAVENLNGAANTRDTERIFASLSDASPQVRCAAIRALERAHNRNSAASLVSALNDPCSQVREAAAHGLGHLREVTSIKPLVERLRDSDLAVRTAAAGALKAMGYIPLTTEELGLYHSVLGKTPATGPGPEADPFLAEPRLAPVSESVEGANPLPDAPDDQSLRLFLAGLGDANPSIRLSAIRALTRVPGEEVTGKIFKLFRDRDASVRLAAIQALAQRDDPAPAFFLGLLDDPNTQIRLAAIAFLGRVRHPQIAEALLPLLSDGEGSVRTAAAAALGSIGDAGAVESLVVSLIDEQQEVRATAERSLYQIDPNWLLSLPTQKARAQIEATLSLCPPQAQSMIRDVLSKIPEPTASPF